jgi:hypothetical protein
MRIVEEYLGSMDLAAAGGEYLFVGGIPNDYRYYGLLVDVEFRDVVGTAALASIIYGSPASFLQRIQVEGNLMGKGTKTIFDMSGRQAWQLARALTGCPPWIDADDFVVDAGATATYDISIQYPIIFPAMRTAPSHQEATLLPGNAMSEPMTLRLTRGGAESLGVNAATSTQTFTSYGAATGNPTAYIHRLIVKEGLGKAAATPIVCRKLRQGPFDLTVSGNDILIGTLNTGQLIGRIFLQTGTKETDAGQSGELASASNALITRVYLRRQDQNIRNFQYRHVHRFFPWFKGLDQGGGNELTTQGQGGQTGGFLKNERVGENLIEFLPMGNLDDALNTIPWPALGQRLQLYGDVTGASNQIVECITETYERAA